MLAQLPLVLALFASTAFAAGPPPAHQLKPGFFRGACTKDGLRNCVKRGKHDHEPPFACGFFDNGNKKYSTQVCYIPIECPCPNNAKGKRLQGNKYGYECGCGAP